MWERFEEKENEKKVKIQKMKEAIKDKDIEGCTFQPIVNNEKRKLNKSRDGIRNNAQFMHDQNEFVRKKQEREMKLKFIKEKELEQKLQAPKINKMSRKIAENIRYAFSP